MERKGGGAAVKKLIKGGTIVTAAEIYQADILIEGETIAAIGHDLDAFDGDIIDAQGLYVFPGGIDPHTHLDMPFGGTVTKDDFETGTIAAAFGGTTTVIDFCLTAKGKPLKDAVRVWHEKSKEKAVIDYGFHLMISEIQLQTVNADRLHFLHNFVPGFTIRFHHQGNDQRMLRKFLFRLVDFLQIHFQRPVGDQFDIVEPRHPLAIEMQGGKPRRRIDNRISERFPDRPAPSRFKSSLHLIPRVGRRRGCQPKRIGRPDARQFDA